ncbi:hypothetical protein L195_g043266, partial [Trifolium pratense]
MGLCRIPSKVVPNLIDPECNLMKKKVYRPPVTSTERLLDEYLGPVYRRNPPCDDAESSSAAAGKSRLVRQCSSSLFVLDSLNECEGFHITMEYSIDNISSGSIRMQFRSSYKWELVVTSSISRGRNVLNFPREYTRNCLMNSDRKIYLIDVASGRVYNSKIFTS